MSRAASIFPAACVALLFAASSICQAQSAASTPSSPAATSNAHGSQASSNGAPRYGLIGDANQDGVFDERDIALVLDSTKGGARLTPEAAFLADVAAPCDKRVNAADLELLRRALRRDSTAPASSECHGQPIGTELDPAEAEGFPTLDEKFVEVARRVPQFGGAYVDSDRKLAIVLTDTDPRILALAQDIFVAVFGKRRIPKDGVKAVKGDFDFRALNDAHMRARALLTVPGAVMIDTNERTNRLVLGASSPQAQTAMEKGLIGLGIPAKMVTFRQVQLPVPGDFPLSTKQLRKTVRPLLGGVQIQRPAGTNLIDVCSLGIIAERSGVPGILTASHCSATEAAVDGTVYQQISEAVATETVDPPFIIGGACPSGRRCRFSDSSFAALTPGITALRGQVATDLSGITLPPGEPFLGPFSFGMTGSQDPFEGENVNKVGRTTGFTSGEVTDTCVDSDVGDDQNNDTGKTMFCQDIADVASGSGDSGSAVWVEGSDLFADPYPATLSGILWGGLPDQMIFSPITAVRNEIGHLTVIQGEDPPTIKILTPANNVKVGFGGFSETTFSATTDDLEEGASCCTVTWQSDIDGGMGVGKTIQFQFESAGTRVITATASNSGGKTSANITVKTVNSPPGVMILKPTAHQDLVTGVRYKFQGRAIDGELFGTLPCHTLKWTSSDALDTTFPKTACNPDVKFMSDGNRTIVLTVKDPEGATGSDSVHIKVGPAAPNSKPVVTILYPNDGESLDPNTAFTLKGTATDSGGNSPINYQWIVDLHGGSVTLGTGTSQNGGDVTQPWTPKTNIPLNCGGYSVPVHLLATDPGGLVGEDTVTVYVPYPVC
jgi:hypothetical protein